MGGSSKQVTGYQYYAFFLLFIGNPIEKLLGINFDKRKWVNPLVDEQGNALDVGWVTEAKLYGENEGGVAGQIHARYGTASPEPVSFYADYLAENSLPPLAYPYQSYLAFPDFYLGNSGYPKEMLLWPKRIHVKNDGSAQWYDEKAEIPDFIYYDNSPETIGGVRLLETHTVEASYVGDYSTELEFSTNSIILNGVEYIYTAFHRFYASASDFNWQPNQTVQQTVTIGAFSTSKRLKLRVYLYGEPKSFILPSNLVLSQTDVVPPTTAGGMDWYKQWEIELVIPANTEIPIVLELETAVGTWASNALRARFEFLFTTVQTSIAIESGDINPIHKIREILTDDTAMNKPESDVNDVNFMKAADRIWDEQLGISWAITEKSCIDAINELCSHIEAGIRVNRQTGLYEMVLFRDDWFEESEIHGLVENKIKTMQIDPINVEDVKNYLNVSHYDRENIKDASFSIAENASIKNAGGFANAEAADFPYFMNQRNAAVVAQWKLKQFTTPCWKGTFTTGYNEARKWNRYDIVKLNWSRKNIVDLPVRIMSINLGDGMDNTVSIGFVEVVPFSDELTSTVVIDDKIDTAPLPPQPAVFKVFELPYFEAVQSQGQKTVDDELAYNPDIGYVAVIAQRPQNNSLNAQMHTDAGAGYENSAVIQYCETAKLDQAIDRLASSFILKNAGAIESVRVGSQIFIDNETMVYQSFDGVTKLLTVKRGALDTVPQAHAADSILFFADDFVAVDQDQYMDGEIIDVKAVTTTPSGVLALDDVDAQSVEIQSRAIRPYPPANVKINGEYFPAEIETDLILTWMDRNRVQQTGGSILGWFDAGVTLENGVTYQLVVVERDENLIELRTQSINVGTLNIYTFATSAMNANTRTIEITLKTLRNGYECYQPFNYTVELSQFFSAPFNLNVEFKND